jgi:hypothetical protein
MPKNQVPADSFLSNGMLIVFFRLTDHQILRFESRSLDTLCTG